MTSSCQVLPDVHEHYLDRKEQADYRDRLGFMPCDLQRFSSEEHIAEDDDSSENKSHPADLKRRSVFQRRLDAYIRASPEK